jgi:hypothetical protein
LCALCKSFFAELGIAGDIARFCAARRGAARRVASVCLIVVVP